MDGKQTKTIMGCAVLLLVIIGVTAACGSGSQEKATAQAEAEQKQQMETALGAVCDGQPVPEAAAYSQTPGAHGALVLRGKTGGSWRVDDSYVSEAWAPQTPQGVELVACLQRDEVLIETCPYQLENGRSASVERYQYETRVTLYEAKTGTVIAETSWLGTEPDKCVQEISFQENELVKKYRGVATGAGEVKSWLQPYVELP